MYNISELQAMPDDTLKSVAEGMGLKKVNPAKREELIYRILDEQAIVLSASAKASTSASGKCANTPPGTRPDGNTRPNCAQKLI